MLMRLALLPAWNTPLNGRAGGGEAGGVLAMTQGSPEQANTTWASHQLEFRVPCLGRAGIVNLVSAVVDRRSSEAVGCCKTASCRETWPLLPPFAFLITAPQVQREESMRGTWKAVGESMDGVERGCFERGLRSLRSTEYGGSPFSGTSRTP